MKKRYIKFFKEDEEYIAYNPDLRFLINLHNDVFNYKLKNEKRLKFDYKLQKYMIEKLKKFYKEINSRYKHVMKGVPLYPGFNYTKNINLYLTYAKEKLNYILNYGYDPVQAEGIIMELHSVIRYLIDFDKK